MHSSRSPIACRNWKTGSAHTNIGPSPLKTRRPSGPPIAWSSTGCASTFRWARGSEEQPGHWTRLPKPLILLVGGVSAAGWVRRSLLTRLRGEDLLRLDGHDTLVYRICVEESPAPPAENAAHAGRYRHGGWLFCGLGWFLPVIRTAVDADLLEQQHRLCCNSRDVSE